MHEAAFRFVERAVADYGDRILGPVVEIGGRNVNGTIRGLFGPDYIATDVAPGLGVDVVADGATYAPPAPAGAVVCCEVLEHTALAEEICANAHRMLAPGGVFIVTAAGRGRGEHSAVDGCNLRAGEFYKNVETVDLEAWLAPFGWSAVEYNPVARDVYAVAIK